MAATLHFSPLPLGNPAAEGTFCHFCQRQPLRNAHFVRFAALAREMSKGRHTLFSH